MTVFDDLVAEQDRLDGILSALSPAQWLMESGAAGWSVADVVLHLAQSEEGVVASAAGRELRSAFAPAASETVDGYAEEMVRRDRAAPSVVYDRWQLARRAAVAGLRAADPQRALEWVAGTVKPATLATTRLAEHWAHGLDIAGPLGISLADTDRLRHIAWLAHRTLPYSMTTAGLPVVAVRCVLTAPSGAESWSFGPEDAPSSITGPAGEFCRFAAQRLKPDAATGLTASGPHGAAALGVLRTYAV
ncbi:MAG TPA: maleylpyruvate isomerase family mycothiol-dependent enzyme [Streptosporangiaceae bacterium]|nr:maleylpyruvate isomerase family mycothiol-dependent enzyme [Streptosporangiaceae bacterium]